MKKQHVTLTDADRTTLTALLVADTVNAKTRKRVTALLELDRGKTLIAVAAALAVDYNTIAAWRNGYRTAGLACLEDAPRSGRPITIDAEQRANIAALARSGLPEGQGRWSLRRLAQKAVEAGVCPSISHAMVRKILEQSNE